jgi:ribokinase
MVAAAGALEAGGVCLLGFEVPDAALVAAARAAASAGARIVLNPAPARAIPEALLGLGVVLTPNEQETEALGGAEALAACTGAPVVVTLGADGALLLDGGSETPLPAPAVEALDTTGAGDAFNGVLAAGLAAGLDLEDAARRAVEAASASVRRAGARG